VDENGHVRCYNHHDVQKEVIPICLTIRHVECVREYYSKTLQESFATLKELLDACSDRLEGDMAPLIQVCHNDIEEFRVMEKEEFDRWFQKEEEE
jgi:hypothetical protein